MSRHQFRLQRVKRVRAVEEDIERARFGAAEVVARTAEDAALLARTAVESAVDDLRGLQGSPVLNPSAVMAALIFVDQARVRLREAEERARGLRAEAETCRRAWLVRVRDLEGLERLEDRSRETFQRQQEQIETRALDEVASQRAAHARRIHSNGGR